MSSPERSSGMEFSGSLQIGEDRSENVGIEKYKLTTAGFLFHPEQAFEFAHELNKDLPERDHITLEVYPTLDRDRIGRVIMGLSNRIGFSLPIPEWVPPLNADLIRQYQAENPSVKVSDVHLPFSHNLHELVGRAVKYERDPERKKRSAGWIVFLGAANNMNGIELAREIGADITAHTNVIEGFAKKGKILNRNGRLDELLIPEEQLKPGERRPRVYAENEIAYDSPILKDESAIIDPIYIAKHIVEKYNVDGLMLGIDHAIEQGIDVHAVLDDPRVQQQTKSIHLADANHGITFAGNAQMESIIRHIGRTKFGKSVSAALDLNPLEMRQYSEREQFQLVKRTFDFITEAQKAA